MKKIFVILCMLPLFMQGQSFDSLASIRYGTLFPNKSVGEKKVHFVGADFLCPIGEEVFYIGGRFSFIIDITRTEINRVYQSPTEYTTYYDEKKKLQTIYPEITFRKYAWERGLCPYAQANVSFASSSLFLGVKPHIMLFELDLSAGYHLPFYKNATERDPFMKKGFQFMLGISVPFEILGIEV